VFLMRGVRKKGLGQDGQAVQEDTGTFWTVQVLKTSECVHSLRWPPRPLVM
jgi:hypothetical protein